MAVGKATTPVKPAAAKAAAAKPAAAKNPPAKSAGKDSKGAAAAPKAGAAKAGAKGVAVAEAAAKAVARQDANHDGAVNVAGDAVKELPKIAATGVGAVVDRRGLLAVVDGIGNKDGNIDANEMATVATRFDKDRNGVFSGNELAAFKKWEHDSVMRYAVDQNGATIESGLPGLKKYVGEDGKESVRADRGFFKVEGRWFFRNEWGSVAAAKTVPNAPTVVDAPDNFDPSKYAAVETTVGNGKGKTANGAPPANAGVGAGGAGAPLAAYAGTGGIFKNNGVMIDQPDNFSDDQARAAREAGFTWIAMQGINAGTDGSVTVRNELDDAWVAKMRSFGFKVGTWNVLGTNATQDARMASDLINQRGLDFMIADAEATHKFDTGGSPKRSAEFTAEFRRLQPKIDLALSTYAASSGENTMGSVKQSEDHAMDFKSWNDAGAYFLPQVYPGEFGDVYSVENTLEHADRAGWRRDRTNYSISFHRGEEGEVFDWYGDMQGKGLGGVNVYLGENVQQDQTWDQVASLA